MNKLQVFNNNEFGNIRVLEINNEPYFILKDVMDILELSNVTELTKRLTPKGLSKTEVLTSGGIQDVWAMNEANFYKCVLRSNKPKAIEFEEWITSEVLPSIRKTGNYSVIPTNQLEPMEVLRNFFSVVDEHNTRLSKIENKIEAVAESVAENIISWREDITKRIKEIAKNTFKGDYKEAWNYFYNKLENEGRCKLEIRLNNMKNRYKNAGHKQTVINQLGKLDVINEDEVLRNLFIKIVNIEYAKFKIAS